MAELPPGPGAPPPGSPPPGSPPPGAPPPLGSTPPPDSMPQGAPPPPGELPRPGALPPPAGFQGSAPGFLPAAAPPAGGGIAINYGGMMSAKRNSEAVGSLVAALVGLVMFCLVIPPIVGGIIAILLAVKAKRVIAASGGTEAGDGMATVGLVVGIVDLAIVAIFGLAIIGAISKAIHG